MDGLGVDIRSDYRIVEGGFDGMLEVMTAIFGRQLV